MAIMYPCIKEKINAPTSEQLAYEELSKLPDDYIIFHSVHWVRKNLTRNFTWYENDYLILHKEYGILLLEIKGGHCYFKNGLMYQENLLTKETAVLNEGNDPLNQAQRGVQHFRKLILKTALKYEGKICIEPLIWFPSCEIGNYEDLPINYKDVSFAILDANAFSAVSDIPLEQTLKKVYDGYGSRFKTSITEEQLKVIQDLIAPDFDLIPCPSIVKTEIDNAFIRLTNEQAIILDYIAEQNYAAIQGVAGTGKTLIARMAAQKFADEKRHVLFLCYNNLLYTFLKNNNSNSYITFYNVDTFVNDYCLAPSGNIEKRMKAYQSINPKYFLFDDIIIDEAQDLGNEEILFFKSLCELKNGHCFIFFDKNQIVTFDSTEKNINSVPDWINQSECRLLLSNNCRNTNEIANTAYSVIDYDVIHRLNGISGDVPLIVFEHNSPHYKLGKAIQLFIKKGFTEDEITILSMKTEAKSFLQDTKIQNHKLKKSIEGDGILFTTARKFKGLENKVIIIIDIDENCFKTLDSKMVFYVACSRAMQQLVLFINESNEVINKIATCIPGKGFSSKGKIIQKTKTKLLNL